VNPEHRHGSAVDDLHELCDTHVFVAVVSFVSHVALTCKFFKNVACFLMTLIASEENS
jgi:hypothetical protein